MRLNNMEREKRNEEIIKLYLTGMAIKDIASRYGLSNATIVSITKDYRQPKKNEVKGNKSIDDTFQIADEETRYIDTLYSYTKSFIKINECALDGMDIKKLKEKVASTKEAFSILSGVEMGKPKDKKQVAILDKKILYSGWLRCPHCGKKLHKVFSNTSMNNFPLWCKQCHKTTIINL
jgi:uncharacterized protein YjcR